MLQLSLQSHPFPLTKGRLPKDNEDLVQSVLKNALLDDTLHQLRTHHFPTCFHQLGEDVDPKHWLWDEVLTSAVPQEALLAETVAD